MMPGLGPTFHVGAKFFLPSPRPLRPVPFLLSNSNFAKSECFKNGLRSAEAFRNENGSGANHLGGRARGGTSRLGRTALGGCAKIAVAQHGAAMQGQLAARQFNVDKKSGPQRRAGRNTGTHRGGSSEGTKRKRAAAEAAAVTEHERQRRRRPSHEAGGG
jgi:hypothetical protein